MDMCTVRMFGFAWMILFWKAMNERKKKDILSVSVPPWP